MGHGYLSCAVAYESRTHLAQKNGRALRRPAIDFPICLRGAIPPKRDQERLLQELLIF